RRSLGIVGRLAHRPLAVADRDGDWTLLEQSAKPSGKRRRRTVAGNLQPLVRTLDLRLARRTARAVGSYGSLVPRGLSVPRTTQPHGFHRGAEALGTSLRPGPRNGVVEVVASGRASGDVRCAATGRLEGTGVSI